MSEDVSKKNYSYLDQLSTEELEAILRASALSEEADDPDLVDHILEVIVLREKEKNDVFELERAHKDFDKLYRNLDKPLYPTTEDETSEAESNKPHLKKAQTKKRGTRRILIAAAIIVALISLTCVPVFGHVNIIRMVAYWTAEQFGFYMPKQGRTGTSNDSSSSVQVLKEYEELQTAMQQLGADLIIPNFPDDFEIGEPILSYFPDEKILKFTIVYEKQDSFYLFDVNRNENTMTNHYEKMDCLVEVQKYDGIDHFFLSNVENNTVSWYIGGIEYCIITNMPLQNIKEILESTYGV